jgi:WD40 repeat protein
MIRKSLLVVYLVLFSVVGSVAAQSDAVRFIDAPGFQFGAKLSPDGKTIATFENAAIHNGEVDPAFLPIRLFDVATGQQKAALTSPTDYASDVAFTPDSATLASMHPNGYVYLWDVVTGKPLKKIATAVGQNRISFLADGKTLALLSALPYSQLLLLDTETGSITAVLTHRYPTYQEFLDSRANGAVDSSVQVLASRDGKSIFVLTMRGNISQWDVASGQERALRESPDPLPEYNIRNIQVTPDGKTLFYYDTKRKNFYTLDVASSQETQAASFSEAPVSTIALSPSGSRLAWASENTIYFAPVNTLDKAAAVEMKLPEGVQAKGFNFLLAFTPDGRQVVYGGFAALGEGKNAIAVINTPES